VILDRPTAKRIITQGDAFLKRILGTKPGIIDGPPSFSSSSKSKMDQGFVMLIEPPFALSRFALRGSQFEAGS
jgi:hypothetical protein